MASHLATDKRSFRETLTAWEPAGPPSSWIGWAPPGGDLDADDQGRVSYCIYLLGKTEKEESLDGEAKWRRYPFNVWVFDHYGDSGSVLAEELETALDAGLAGWDFIVDDVSEPVKHPNGLWFQQMEGRTWPTTT